MVSNFIVQALKDEPITLYGDGQQTRSFCYVDDLIEGLIRLMEIPAEVTGPGQSRQSGRVHHQGAGRAGHRSRPARRRSSTYLPLPQDDPKQRRPDISLAKAKLDWEPQVALADGLKPTIAYFAERLTAESAKELRRVAAAEPTRKRRARAAS